MPRPFLKWAGGKAQLLPQLLPRFPAQFKRYFEPFLGGGAVFFDLAPKRAILSDINAELIHCYSMVRDQVDDLIGELKLYPNQPTFFYQLRAQKPETLHCIQRAARLIYLNRTCYNGLYRVNQQGLFNVPFGRYSNPTICNEQNLKATSQVLKKIELINTDVFDIANKIRPFDLVYLDPPYHPVNKTSRFKSYTQFAFGVEQQTLLADMFKLLAKQQTYVVLSNSDTPLIRELYRDFPIETVMAKRSINRMIHKRGFVHEVIVRSWS